MFFRVVTPFVVILVQVLCIATGNQQAETKMVTFKNDQGDKVTVTYAPVGCFKDTSEYRALRKLYYNDRPYIDWDNYPDMSSVINTCAKEAYLKGYRTLFGVQFWGECWSDGSATMRYFRLGESQNCEHGVGMNWANYVYRFTAIHRAAVKAEGDKCYANGKEYNEGDMMYVPNEWLVVSHAQCRRCECSRGQARDCHTAFLCDSRLVGSMCETYRTRPGACCPSCACVDQGGKPVPINGSWAVRHSGKCAECTCSSAGEGQCVEVTCHCEKGYEPDSTTQSGECCPKCLPVASTPRPTEIIPVETTRAATHPPLLPPRPDGAKRERHRV